MLVLLPHDVLNKGQPWVPVNDYTESKQSNLYTDKLFPKIMRCYSCDLIEKDEKVKEILYAQWCTYNVCKQ